MKKNRINMLLIVIAGCIAYLLVFNSCDDYDPRYGDNDDPVEITSVHLQNSRDKVKDRTISFARLDQLIRLEGNGFFGVKEVYINGKSAYINPTLMSDNSMIVRVPKDAPITGAADDVRNTIVLKKKNLIYKYDFEIRSAAPEITNISHTMPLAGEWITVEGSGLIEVSKVVFPGNIEVTADIIQNEDGEFFKVKVPSGVAEKGGSIFVECANGGAYSPAYFNCKIGLILNFDGIGEQAAWTSNAIYAADLQSEVIGIGHVSQGKYCPMIPGKLAPVDAGKDRATEVWTTGNENWRELYVATGLFSESTPLNEIAFQFDIYVPENWNNTGFLGICLANNFSANNQWTGEFYNVIPWLIAPDWSIRSETIPYKTEGWTTKTVPLTKFYKYAGDKEYTFEDILAFREGAANKNFGMLFHNNDFTLKDITRKEADEKEFKSSQTSVKIYVDNFRLVSLETPEYSDFPDEK